MVKLAWLAAAHAATHRSRGPLCVSPLARATLWSERSPRRVGAQARLRRRSGCACPREACPREACPREACPRADHQLWPSRRFQLAEGGSVRLQADDGSAVDSIEGLLEVDESSTLLVALEGGSSGSAGGEPSASRLRGGAGASPARPAAAYATPVGAGGCRVDIPVSEWARGGHRGGGEHEETGDLKYRKRQQTANLSLEGEAEPALIPQPSPSPGIASGAASR
jgi:hypothetical protein